MIVDARPYDPADVAADLAAVRSRVPLTHCMTNKVVIGFTANVLLAAGAAPAMVEDSEEAAEFAAAADALLLNVGTLGREQATAMRAAARSAQASGTPWVLDPVAVGALRFRTSVAVDLLAFGPAVIRGNASEVLSLAGADGAAGRGVESMAQSSDAVDAARALAAAHGCVVAVSGVVDYVTDGRVVYAVPGGDPMMTKVTGVGCALGALIAAYCAVADSPLRAAISASAVLADAGTAAAQSASGPGSFAVHLLDALAA